MPPRKASTQRSRRPVPAPVAESPSSGSEAEASDIEDITDAMQSGAQTLMDVDYSSSPAPPSPPEKPSKKSKSKASSEFIKTITAFASGEHGAQKAVRSMLASSSSAGGQASSRLKQAQQETNRLLKRKPAVPQTAQHVKGKGKATTSKYKAGTNMVRELISSYRLFLILTIFKMKPAKQVKQNTTFRVQSIIILHKGVTAVSQHYTIYQLERTSSHKCLLGRPR